MSVVHSHTPRPKILIALGPSLQISRDREERGEESVIKKMTMNTSGKSFAITKIRQQMTWLSGQGRGKKKMDEQTLGKFPNFVFISNLFSFSRGLFPGHALDLVP